MNKILKISIAAVAAALGTAAVAGCGGTGSETETVKVGLITLHDNTSTYDKNFIDAFNAACKAKGVKGIVISGVEEDATCTEKANDLVDQGCKFVFADSFGHESFLLESAKKNPDVQYSHATGTMAHTEKVANFHNAFASIYEGRYLAGVAAGMKLKEMKEANASTPSKVGYIGAFTYAEVISGYTSWYLGVKSIVEDVTMDVTFTGSWYDEAAEKAAAETLIKDHGCALISQHADSMGAPTACETAKVPNVSYNGSTEASCPDTFIVSSKIDWQPYFESCFDVVKTGKGTIPTDFVGTIDDGSVKLTSFGKKATADGTEAKVNEVKAALKDGSLKVFDCSKFTVDGAHLTTYLADVDTDPAYAKDTEAIVTERGVTYFAESKHRSAPYFDITIDGITLLNSKF